MTVRRDHVLRALPTLLLTVCFSTAVQPQENPVAASQAHLQDASAAYRAGDAQGFTTALEAAYELNPASIYTRYNLARGYAATDQPDKAMALLRGLVNARIDSGMANDPDLEVLRERPEFRQLLRRLEADLKPQVTSTAFVSVDLLGLIPEGIAYEPASKRFFFGSMRSGDVYVLDADLQLSRFATIDTGRRLSAIGMTVDTARHRLWVAGSAFEMAEGYIEDADIPAGIFAIDLTTGEVMESYLASDGGSGINDVALGPDGTLYASGDTLRVLDEQAGRLVPLTTTPALFGSNGISIDPTGKTLYASSYPVGIAAVDLETGAMSFLDAPADVSLYGVDGLYWHEGDLIGIQNGIRPWRLLRLSFNADRSAFSAARNLEFASEATTPTTGAIIDGEIYYVGQGPQPAELPGHFPEALAPFMGKTIIRRARLQ